MTLPTGFFGTMDGTSPARNRREPASLQAHEAGRCEDQEPEEPREVNPASEVVQPSKKCYHHPLESFFPGPSLYSGIYGLPHPAVYRVHEKAKHTNRSTK